MTKWKKKTIDKEKYLEYKEKKLEDIIAYLSSVIGREGIAEGTDKIIVEDPFLHKDMDKAVDRILEEISNHGHICIFGDYDCDGMTATALLYSYILSVLEYDNISYFIPNRLESGYGLTVESIKQCLKQNTKISLVITVDCGITAVDEVEYLKEKGIDCIITDHHQPKEILPDAIAVVDPKRKDENKVFTEYAGVGVAYKLIEAISKKRNIAERKYNIYLPFVALRNNSRYYAPYRAK